MVDRASAPIPMTIELLDRRAHDPHDFNCGVEELDYYLKAIADRHAKKGYSQTWVAVPEPGTGPILGYYTLSTTSLSPIEVPEKPKVSPVPAVLLGKLAVDLTYHNAKIGVRLLLHAQRTVQLMSRSIGIYTLVVDALNDEVADYYRRYDFIDLCQIEDKSGTRLYKTVKDIAKMGLLSE